MDKTIIVDPGFVHHRKIETFLGAGGTEIINLEASKIPAATPEWRKEVVTDQIYTRITIQFCKVNEIKTLDEVLLSGCGRLFCSIVKVMPCPEVYEGPRAVMRCAEYMGSEYSVELHFSTNRVRGDTLRAAISDGGEFAIVAAFSRKSGSTLIFEPLIVGFPYIHDANTGELLWEIYTDVYGVHLEDFKEFSKVSEFELPDSFDEMRSIREGVFKECLGKILKESTPKDWGGEASDFFTSHLHIGSERVRVAFLLKGPSKFSPMTLSHLGKNSDQIVRLSKEPADVLVVQHCHDILSPVLETLKVFATQPSNPRRYCVIDGRESLRLLEAYDLAVWAKYRSAEIAKEKA